MIVLDASAILAVLFGERGGEIVVAEAKGAAISAVNYSEVIASGLERAVPEARIKANIARLRLEIVPFDAWQAEAAGALREVTRRAGLSLGDRACLALALSREAEVLTSDRAWTTLDLGVGIRLIR